MYYTQPEMLEAKAVLSAFLWLFGVPAWIFSILLNIGTWKADVIFALTAILLLARIIHLIRTQHQQYQKRKMDLEDQKFELNKKKKSANK